MMPAGAFSGKNHICSDGDETNLLFCDGDRDGEEKQFGMGTIVLPNGEKTAWGMDR